MIPAPSIVVDTVGGRYGDARSPANAAAATSAIVLQVAARERQRPPPPTPPASPSSPPPAIRQGIVALNIPHRIARHTNVTATNLVPIHRTFQHRRDNLAHRRRPLVLGSGPRRLSLAGNGGGGSDGCDCDGDGADPPPPLRKHGWQASS
jgi:hypothetical protein